MKPIVIYFFYFFIRHVSFFVTEDPMISVMDYRAAEIKIFDSEGKLFMTAPPDTILDYLNLNEAKTDMEINE